MAHACKSSTLGVLGRKITNPSPGWVNYNFLRTCLKINNERARKVAQCKGFTSICSNTKINKHNVKVPFVLWRHGCGYVAQTSVQLVGCRALCTASPAGSPPGPHSTNTAHRGVFSFGTATQAKEPGLNCSYKTAEFLGLYKQLK